MMKLDIEKVGRAIRLRMIRKEVGLSRRAFSEKSGIPPRTIQNWEDEGGTGLTIKGSEKIINSLKKMGLYCSPEWLLHGIGEMPTIQNDADKRLRQLSPSITTKTETETEINDKVYKEIDLLKKHENDIMDIRVSDNSMQPRFEEGDFVAGKCLYGEDICKAIGKDCIVVTTGNKKMLRHVKKGSTADYYNLISTNIYSDAKNLLLEDVSIIMVAPVVWIRKII